MNREILRALAETVLPSGQTLPGAGEGTLLRLEAFLGELPESLQTGYRGLLATLDLHTRARFGDGFARQPLGRRLAVLESWSSLEPTRLGLRGLLSPIKLAYFEDPTVYAALGCRFAVERPPLERARSDQQITPASSLSDGELLECDVVVVGTGAGGAPVAYELASRGLAVVLVEEGERFTRQDFTGRPIDMLKKLYRRGGATLAMGNTAIPIPLGRAVGGTTLINSGTCFRVPESTVREWKDEYGLDDLDGLDPYYQTVERIIGVGPSSKKALGKPAELIARGCDALGYSHHPLNRNAPGCDGQGLCCFGCPTDAKRSTNVSFVPMALEKGAQLLTGLRVEKVLTRDGRAIGVEGLAGEKRITVHAKAVVLSCGTLHTPALLEKNGLANNSGMLGRNLSIHPATAAIGRFNEVVNSASTVPQGYAIDEFKSEGILFEGSSVPLDITAVSLTGFGPSYVALMEDFNHTLGFGFMVKDSSRGRVTAGKQGEPKISYWLNDRDLKLMRRGMGILARVFFAAGAEEVHAPVAGFERLRGLDDVARMEAAALTARKIDITAYHPLGTARMGKDPLSSVVDPTHETWDVHNLFIVDGSAVPGSLGVNPQLTIMAMSLRAAEFVARRVERLSRAA